MTHKYSRNYTNIDEFKKDDDTIDWQALEEARIKSGEACSQCKSFILFPTGTETKCGNCQEFDESKESVEHGTLVRCPSCKHQWDIERYFSSNAEYDIFEEGEHNIICPECEHEFEVTTKILRSYISPELI